jgi:hypothetical protein
MFITQTMSNGRFIGEPELKAAVVMRSYGR